MIVYAADGGYVKPKKVDILFLGVGERCEPPSRLCPISLVIPQPTLSRTDQAFVKLDNPGDWTIRIANNGANQVISGYGVLSYTDTPCSDCGKDHGLPGICGDKIFTEPPTDQGAMNYGGHPASWATVLDPMSLAVYPPTSPPQCPDTTLIWQVSRLDARIWTVDGIPYLNWREQEVPALIKPQITLDAGVGVSLKNGSVVDIVLNVSTLGQPNHVSALCFPTPRTAYISANRFSHSTSTTSRHG
jgi:FtsP/CotA-like multicopper oxidase with cupredoxin domain